MLGQFNSCCWANVILFIGFTWSQHEVKLPLAQQHFATSEPLLGHWCHKHSAYAMCGPSVAQMPTTGNVGQQLHAFWAGIARYI